MFSGTISGLLAYGISFMNGLAGLAGWRWMFIMLVSDPRSKVSPPRLMFCPIFFQRRHPRHLLRGLHLLLPPQLPRHEQFPLGRREACYHFQPPSYATFFLRQNLGSGASQISAQGSDVLHFHPALDLSRYRRLGSEHCATDRDLRVGTDRDGGGAVDDYGEPVFPDRCLRESKIEQCRF